MRTFLLFIILLISHSTSIHAQRDSFFLQFGNGLGLTEGYHSIETSDGGYLLFGGLTGVDISNPHDPWISKMNANGAQEWDFQMDFGGIQFWDLALSGIESNDGYIMLGNFMTDTSSGYFTSLVKLDFDGQLLWSKVLDNYEFVEYGAILGADSGSFFLAGKGHTGGSNVASLMKLDANGEVLWEQTYPNSSNSSTSFYDYDIEYAKDGGILWSDNINESAILFKSDTSGNLIWQTQLIDDTNDNGIEIEVLEDGEIVVLVTLRSSPGPSEHLIRLDPTGAVIDSLRLDHTFIQKSFDIAVDGAGNIYRIGRRLPDERGFLLKTSPTGEVLWSRALSPLAPAIALSLYDIHIGSDGRLLITGHGMVSWSSNLSTPGYIYFAKVSPDGCIISSTHSAIPSPIFEVYPLPATEGVYFRTDQESLVDGKVLLYDELGRLIREEALNSNPFYLERKHLAAGNYFYRITSKEKEATGVLIFK